MAKCCQVSHLCGFCARPDLCATLICTAASTAVPQDNTCCLVEYWLAFLFGDGLVGGVFQKLAFFFFRFFSFLFVALEHWMDGIDQRCTASASHRPPSGAGPRVRLFVAAVRVCRAPSALTTLCQLFRLCDCAFNCVRWGFFRF